MSGPGSRPRRRSLRRSLAHFHLRREDLRTMMAGWFATIDLLAAPTLSTVDVPAAGPPPLRVEGQTGGPGRSCPDHSAGEPRRPPIGVSADRANRERSAHRCPDHGAQARGRARAARRSRANEAQPPARTPTAHRYPTVPDPIRVTSTSPPVTSDPVAASGRPRSRMWSQPSERRAASRDPTWQARSRYGEDHVRGASS